MRSVSAAVHSTLSETTSRSNLFNKLTQLTTLISRVPQQNFRMIPKKKIKHEMKRRKWKFEWEKSLQFVSFFLGCWKNQMCIWSFLLLYFYIHIFKSAMSIECSKNLFYFSLSHNSPPILFSLSPLHIDFSSVSSCLKMEKSICFCDFESWGFNME
jgi:hypothetical protein